MIFTTRIITYGNLHKGLHFENDKYGIATYEYEPRRNAFLANPIASQDVIDDLQKSRYWEYPPKVARKILDEIRLKYSI